MKYFKRLKIYKASAVTFNPETLNAYSYEWWRFVAKVENKIVFNNYYYSPSTRKHQAKVRSLLHDLGIKIDITMPLHKGIDDRPLSELILEAEETLCNQFLHNQIKKQDAYQRRKERLLAAKQAQAVQPTLTLVGQNE